MRGVIKLAIVLAVLWSGWWLLASIATQYGAERVLAARAGDGWRAQVSQGGFPFTLRTVLRDLNLRDPDSGTALRTEALAVSAPAWWPGDVTVDLGRAPLMVETPVTRVTVEAGTGEAGLRASPSPDLPLDVARIDARDLAVSMPLGVVATGQALQARLAAVEGPLYDLSVAFDGLAPGPDLLSALRLPSDWAARPGTLRLGAQVLLDRLLDRHLTDRPRPRRVELREVSLAWGAVALSAEGVVEIDAAGLPEGSLALSVAGWEEALALAAQTGLVAPALLAQAQLLGGALATLGGNPGSIDLALTLRDGRARLEDIDLGPVPPLW